MYQVWLRYVEGLLRNGLTSCLAYFLFGFTSLLINGHIRAAELLEAGECVRVSWSEDHLGQVLRRLDNICDKRGLLKGFDQIQYGGK